MHELHELMSRCSEHFSRFIEMSTDEYRQRNIRSQLEILVKTEESAYSIWATGNTNHHRVTTDDYQILFGAYNPDWVGVSGRMMSYEIGSREIFFYPNSRKPDHVRYTPVDSPSSSLDKNGVQFSKAITEEEYFQRSLLTDLPEYSTFTGIVNCAKSLPTSQGWSLRYTGNLAANMDDAVEHFMTYCEILENLNVVR